MTVDTTGIRIFFIGTCQLGLVLSLRQFTEVIDSSTSLAIGSRLRNRYVLHSFSHRRLTNLHEHADDDYYEDPEGEEGSSFDGNPIVGEDFPTHEEFPSIPERAHINAYGSAKLKHLGRGSFGDVWKAYDEKLNRFVVVKIFYDYVKGMKRYTTKKQLQKIDKLHRLDRWKIECLAVKKLVEHADILPEGAKAICQCFDEHISDASDDDPLFLVQELCGSPLDEIFEEGHYRKEKPPYWNREVIKDVLQGVKFLSMLSPPRIHHDLKLENVGVMPDGQGKLLDFGALVTFEKDGSEGGTCTPQYVPPEVNCSYGPSYDHRSPAAAFDTYSVGVMYWELMCNQRPDWVEDETDERGYRITNPIPAHQTCPNQEYGIGTKRDFDIIKGLLKQNPRRRMAPAEAEEKLELLTNATMIADHVETWDVTARNYWRPSESRCNSYTKKAICLQDKTNKCIWESGICHLAGHHVRKAFKQVKRHVKQGVQYAVKCLKCLKMKIFGKSAKNRSAKVQENARVQSSGGT